MKPQERIDNVTAGFMIGVAALIDGVKFFLDLTVVADLFTWILGGAAAVIFFMWFMIKGVNYNGPKAASQMLVSLSAVIVDLVPFINALPATTAGVLGVIINSRIEDAKKVNPAYSPQQDRQSYVGMARIARLESARRQEQAQQLGQRLEGSPEEGSESAAA